VYYSDGGELAAYSGSAAVVSWDEGDGTALSILNKMMECLDKPVLVENDFKREAG